MKTTRRRFLRNGGVVVASTALLGNIPLNAMTSDAGKKNRSIGFQVWTIREKLVSNFAPVLEEMAAMGYSEVEMCSPLGYSEFKPLNHLSGAEMKKIIDGTGLKCTSSHFNMGELRDSLENRIEWALELGMKQMVASSFGLPEDASLDDYRSAAVELNGIAEKTKAAGLQMGFHNHHGEFKKIGGELIYDALLAEFDPDLVKMQFQVAVVSIGYQAADYFRKYPGRFISAHLADWSAEKDKQVPIGQGEVDWIDFFKAAKKGGVKNFFVEMDPETFKPSIDFLTSL